MRQTATAYDPYPDARKADVRVRFRMEDVRAAADAAVWVSENHAFASRPAQMVADAYGMAEKYGTLERDQFLLDGSCKLFPSDPDTRQVGWWSAAQSDENGVFAVPPVLTFQFTEPHASAGFTVVFDDKAQQYCTQFTLAAYGADGAELARAEVEGNTKASCRIWLQTEGYRKVVVTLRKTNLPLRFARVSQVVFGFIQDQQGQNTPNLSLLYEIDPVMDSAPADELTITIDNAGRHYNLVNPNGFYRYLQQGQAMDVEMGVGPSGGALEYVKMGRFFFTASRAQDDGLTAEITAHSPFYSMDKTIYAPISGGTKAVRDLIAAIFGQAGFPMEVRDVGGVGARLVGCDPGKVTHREAVRMAAQAARCVCQITRDQTVLLFDPLPGTPVDDTQMGNQYHPPVVETVERINTVVLKVGDAEYTARNLAAHELEQRLEVSNPLVTEGQAVAEWLLRGRQDAYICTVTERGNPAREVGDTVRIHDLYGEHRPALATKLTFDYDGTLQGGMEARGWFSK